ncbi:MAG: carbonic anhydrase [Segetibacter sp.]|nr:carbonic anhydrase [Segetibacter sp.]
MRTLTKDLQEKITPQQALNILREGNSRFMQNLKAHRNLLEQANETSEGQYPFAVILSCMDSRTSAELIFDQGLGDVFSIRIAGNVINEDILGSMEFACKVAGSKFILVLGHTKCGAIKGACDQVKIGHLSTLLSKIKPAVNEETATKENRTSSNASFVENVAEINVKRNVQEILNRSSIIRDLVKEEKIGIAGAMYNVASGKVEFYNDTVTTKQSQEVEAMNA